MKIKLKQFGIWTVIAGIICVGSYAAAQETPSASLDSYVQDAVRNNPQVQAAYHRWKAEEYKIKQVKSLSDPMVSYTYFGESAQTRTGPQEQKFGFSQKIPFPGKLKLKGKAQAKQAEAAKEQYEAVKREIIEKVKLIYYDLYWVDKAIEIREEEKGILDGLERVTRRKYEMNLVSQQDVIKAQVALTKLINKFYRLNQNRESLQAKLNSVLNRNTARQIDKISVIDVAVFSYSLESLDRVMEQSNQKLLAADLKRQKAEHEKTLATMDYLPDFTLGGEYIEIGGGTTTRADDGKDAWMGKVTVNVPIWFGRISSKIKEKKEKLKEAESKLDNAQDTVRYDLQDMYFKVTTNYDILRLYETALVPQTEQAFQAARFGYESGEVDFLNWLDAERTLLQTKLAYHKAIVDYQKAIAYLERIVGKNLM